ncbi:MAG: M3 family oligoendopeptidase [Phycisphaerales bacterium]|nr:MAG: M3 family oligoendopeptidase [Phycisphaerales bacterium]
MTQPSYPRSFVAADADLGDWSQIEPYFRKLGEAPLDTPAQFEQWLLDGSELAACLDQERVTREVAMTQATDDEDREKRYLDFVQNIQPLLKPEWFGLQKKFVEAPTRKQLASARYAVLDRSVANAVELFREENVPLETEEDVLEQQYQKLCGAMTVEYKGAEYPLPQMAPFQLDTDRAVRQETWELVAARRLQGRDAIEGLFDRLVRLRHRIAINAGFDEYLGFGFRAKERFDYTEADCRAFYDAVAECVVPLMRELREQRRAQLGVEPLRPWDLAVDVKGRVPLRPFDTVNRLIAGCARIFGKVDSQFAGQFETMHANGWLDLESRKGKAPGGYQETYQEERRPFIFMNAVGLHRDVETLLHEGGHAFHTFACREEPLMAYRHAPIEFCEVASMGMELLCLDHLGEFYRADEFSRAKREQLEGIIQVLAWIATIDAFQHWIYRNPEHTREQRRDHWLALHRRFGGQEDYSGYQEQLAYAWHRQLHPFIVPLYYIEYGIAQLGALQIWLNAKADYRHTVQAYQSALALGGSRPLPELFEAAGIRFDFSAETMVPLVDTVRSELDALPM